MEIKSTKNITADNGIKVLVYGSPGVGKTRLCSTINEPALILSAEAGLLSLRNYDIDTVEVSTVDSLREVFHYLRENQDEGKYKWVCLDSITEIAEQVLTREKSVAKDPRQAYGALIDQVTMLVRCFRDLPGRNVYMSAKMERTKDELSGALLYSPSMPGAKLAQQIPYFFDEVFALRSERKEDGSIVRWLQTEGDSQYLAKDRSACLEAQELPSLSTIENTINASTEKN